MLVDIDDDYLQDIKKLDIPSHFRILSSEATFPFTKPKVCNLGLITTDAEFVTVYDAEDAPEPDQLLKVLYKFNEDNNISVGTFMGMDLREEQGCKPYSRQRDLRQVFTFSLEEYDMELLCKVSNLDNRSGIAVENQIDFTSRRLWM